MSFQFKIKAKMGQARAGELITPHGVVQTPIFMPVGTQACVKALTPEDLKAAGAQIILGGNTYHMFLRPGLEVVKKMGGMHKFMNWDRPMLTDSGGFQVFSLGAGSRLSNLSHLRNLRNLIKKNGVWFTSHLDGSRHFLSPEKSIQIQKILGADIIMAFDECTPGEVTKSYAREAMERTHQWLVRCKKAWWANLGLAATTGQFQALFGIIQGGRYEDLRRESAKFIVEQNLSGIALGGQTVGFEMKKTVEIIQYLREILPAALPLYTMGVGQNPEDIIAIIKAGVDIFDCVAPTRLARNGALYSGDLKGLEFESEFPKGRLNISQARFKTDPKPIDEHCDCQTCRQGFTRAYLHHLFKARELAYYRLASIHNVRFMLRLCQQTREILKKYAQKKQKP